MRSDTNFPAELCSRSATTLQLATSRSAEMDLATACKVTILYSSVYMIPTGVNGHLGQGKSVLLLGHSSTTLLGFFVLPRVIDADFLGEIKIMVWTPFRSCTVVQGSKIFQLIFFTTPMPTNTVQKLRG